MEKIKKYLKQNVATISLCLIYVVVYFLQYLEGFEDALCGAGRNFLDFQVYRLFTNTFLHFGLVHLLGNIAGLLAVGSLLEHKLGKLKFVLIYFACGVLAEIVFTFCYLNNYGGGGASGCIFGLIGVFVAYYLSDNTVYEHKWYRVDLYTLIIYSIVANIKYDDFFSLSIGSTVTHAFGFVMGVLIILILDLIKRKKETKEIQNNA